jgi:hypothetical protein
MAKAWRGRGVNLETGPRVNPPRENRQVNVRSRRVAIRSDPRTAMFVVGHFLLIPRKAGKVQKPAFPTSDLERTGIVVAALMQANRPLDASALARSFRQGTKVEPAISRILASLARLGHVHTSDGKTFALRRTA